MPEPYVPTMEVVRDAVTFPRDRLGEPRPISGEAFDRFIKAIKAKARAEAFNDARHTMQLSLDAAINPLRAEAWDEGAAAAFRDALRATPGVDFSNPYREQEEASD